MAESKSNSSPKLNREALERFGSWWESQKTSTVQNESAKPLDSPKKAA